MAHRTTGTDTRKQLLEAAEDLFADRGFRNTTVEAICNRAGANIAAVNYHFGSKRNLYTEAWRNAFERSLKAHPADGGVPSDAPARERLRGRIRSLMQRILDPHSRAFDIVHMELANPTGHLRKVMEKSIDPLQKAFRKILRELLGPGTPAPLLELCWMSVKSQCFGPLLHERRRRRTKDHPLPLLHNAIDIDTYADHVVRFSLAGIDASRRKRRGKK